MSRTLVLGKSDYERMKSLAINGQTIKETLTRSQLQQTIDRKQALHEKSLAETATWNHTIVGNRAARLEAKTLREEAREMELQRLDLEEEEREAQERQKMIAKAKAMLYQNNDQVKTVRKGDFLAEILRERDAQKDFAGTRTTILAEQDAMIDRMRMEAADREIQAELEKQEDMRADATTTAKTQLEQAAMKRALRKAQRQAELAEQSAINEDSAAYFIEEGAKVGKQKATMHKFIADRTADIENTKQRKAEYRKILELEQVRNKQYLASKEKMTTEWKAKMLEVRRTKQAARTRMADTLKAETDNRDEEENALIQKVMEEKWRAEDEREVRKAVARAENTKKCSTHMQHTVALKQEAAVQRVASAKQQRAQIEAENLKAIEAEMAKQTRRFNEAADVSKTHLASVEKHKLAVERETQAERQARIKMEADMEAEQTAVIAYALSRKEAAIQRGCTNLYPLDIAIKEVGPRVAKPAPNLPSVMTRKRGNPYPGNSKARMGFIY